MNDAVFASRKGPLRLDLSNVDTVFDRLSSISPDSVINAAGFTSVDGCEREKRSAYLINGLSVREITRYCRVKRIPLIHISTDYVFDGSEGDYHEESVPNPINFYGLSKLVGDAFALSYDESLLIRTSGVFGSSKNFPMFILEKLQRREKVFVLDGYYSPIFSDLLAEAILQLIQLEKRGITNVAGERVSRIKFAELIANRFGLDRSLLAPSEGKLILAARRPYDSSLNIEKARSIINFDFFSVERNLQEFYDRIRKEKHF
jgi:dTDP-4-dehydrorhamnose reductase